MDEQSFFTIDRLVEFDISLGITLQMVSMMNQCMKSMNVLVSIQSMPKIIKQVLAWPCLIL